MPRHASNSKRKAAPIQVPDLEQDAAERKRVLNVLAQRRYRERKREHLKQLESQLESVSSPPSVVREASQDPFEDLPNLPEKNILSNQAVVSGSLDQLFDGLGWTSEPFDTSLQALSTSSPLPSLPGSPIGFSSTDTTSPGQNTSSSTSPSSVESPDWPPIQEMDFASALQTTSTRSYTFPDERHASILELKLARGLLLIAKRMNVEDLLWSPTSRSPFTDPALSGLSFDHLPVNLRPTKIQQLIPHHPLLDVLAWPAVRDKLILVFSQNVDARPPVAASPTALYDLVYDIEDSAEGVRIWGDDPCTDENWEVGEAVFKKWWWALDSTVLRTSNKWRRERGAPMLGAGFVLGEV